MSARSNQQGENYELQQDKVNEAIQLHREP